MSKPQAKKPETKKPETKNPAVAGGQGGTGPADPFVAAAAVGEGVGNTALVPSRIGAGIPGFTIARRVTMPTFNPKPLKPVVFRIDDAFRLSTYIDPDPKKRNEKPATICSVTNMQTGEVGLWLVAEVAMKNIAESYPDDSYVGRIFGIQKLPKRDGKRYFDFEIAELTPT